MIKTIFVTQLNKEFSIYGLISFSGKTKKNKLDLTKPSEKFKFQLIKDTYKNNIKLELGKVHNKKSFNVVSDKVLTLEFYERKEFEQLVQKDK